MKKLVIAEKPSVAQTVAKALGVSEKGKGCIEGDDYVVTWCYGHMLEFRDDPRYAKWNMDDLPIIPETWRYEPIPSPQSKEQLKNIISLINRKDITGIVCATDAGREGELIFRLWQKVVALSQTDEAVFGVTLWIGQGNSSTGAPIVFRKQYVPVIVTEPAGRLFGTGDGAVFCQQ